MHTYARVQSYSKPMLLQNMENSLSAHRRNISFLLLLLLLCFAARLQAATSVIDQGRRLPDSIRSTPLVLQYHKGHLLTGPGSINVYILWYGDFSHSQKAAISDFFSSIGANVPGHPSVKSWWATTQQYKDSAKRGISPVVKIGGHYSDARCSRGKKLKGADIPLLVKGALAKNLFPTDSNGIYIVLTSHDVIVERFCTDTCGSHDSIRVSNSKAGSKQLLLAWVGNSGVQCPGLCAWPFAATLQGSRTPPLIPPNGDVGVDGMIINIATILAETATNPLNTGYYQGDARAPLEAVTACAGIFGKGAHPNYPGELLVDKKSKASYNAYGMKKRMYLLPAMWNPSTRSCKTTLT